VRSRFGMGSAGLLFGVLTLAVGGCGSISGGLSPDTRSAVLDSPHSSNAWRPASPGAPLTADAAGTSSAAVAAERRGDTGAAPSASLLIPAAPKPPSTPLAFEPIGSEPSPPSMIAFAAPLASPGPVLAQAQKRGSSEPLPDVQIEEYDPWEPFNEKMFTFNYNFDKYLLKPVAKGYNVVMPDRVQQMIDHGFDNITVAPRLVNNLLQWNLKGFGTELGRFVINSTFGIGGLFDIAKQEFGIEKSKADFGQTLGKWGVQPGPFLILPFLPPLTVRDGIGYAADGAMDPLSYVLPFFWDRLGMKIGDTVNDRALNLDLFQGFEETTVDLYSAVRNGYLQRRYYMIKGGSSP